MPCTTDPTTTGYGLHRPTVVDAYDAIVRLFGDGGEARWTHLCGAALQRVPGPLTIDALLDAMDDDADAVIRLSARSLRIRVRAFDHLAGGAA